ncbi:MAG: hypothetical protein ABSB36_04220 [Candidatus Dormibacteria bacterium]|jgi:hypothetical protein
MRDHDSAGAPARPGRTSELLLVEGLTRAGRAAALVLAAAVATGWGFAALALHQQALATRAGGASLGPLGTLFADGSSALTAWPGWLAAVILGVSARRLRRGPVEPPAGRSAAGQLSAAEVRAGLRREYLAVRLMMIAVSGLTLADLARLAVSGIAALLGVGGAGGGLPWMGAEVIGLGAATAALTAWALGFRRQLERVGALQPRRAHSGVDGSPT